MPKISLLKVRQSLSRIQHYERKQVALCPDNAVNRLAWRAPYRTDRKALRNLFSVAVVAFRFPLTQ